MRTPSQVGFGAARFEAIASGLILLGYETIKCRFWSGVATAFIWLFLRLYIIFPDHSEDRGSAQSCRETMMKS